MRIVNGKPTSAINELQGLWDVGEYRKALKLAAGWPRLGKHRDAIQAGWAAISNPSVYREMGKDPDTMYAEALAAIAERYDLEPAKEVP